MNIGIKYFFFLMILILLISVPSEATEQEKKLEIGIEEHQGQFLPLDAKFVTSSNDTVLLKNVIKKPFLLDIVYYNCPGICHPLLTELVWAVDRIKMTPGEDFQVITLSFDPTEKYDIARKWKNSYLSSMKRKIDEQSWYFLTGDSVNIKKITDAVGFDYKPNGGNFIHAGAIVAISPEGKISRYIYGSTFNPFDLQMALIDAQNEEIRPTSAKLLQFCFSYDPEGRRYTLNVTRIAGVLMMVGLAGFFVFIVIRKNKKGVKIDG